MSNSVISIEKNTIDVSIAIYPSAREFDYRFLVKGNPDLEDMVSFEYQELEGGCSEKDYITKNSLSFNKEDWHKIQYAVDTFFEKNI